MNKASIKIKCSQIVNSTPHGTWLSGDDEKFVQALLEFHPEKVDKVGSGVTRFIVRLDPEYRKNSCFYIVRADGTEIDFSFMKCLHKDNMTPEQGRNFTW